MSSFEEIEKQLSDEEWYDTARAKVNSFLHTLDPHLKVRSTPVKVTTVKGKYDTLALSFESEVDPSLKWTMEIEKSHDYIDNKLEGIVRKICAERRRGI